MIKIAIFASGRGSNAKALLESERHCDEIEITTLLTDQPDAGVIEIARQFQKPILIIPKKGKTKVDHEIEILKKLPKVDWIFLAGYMQILSSDFIEQFYDPQLAQSRIINIHPSLLPDYPGMNAYERAYSDQVNTSGVTIHYVDSGIDTGQIIKQMSFIREENMTLDDFTRTGLILEHQLYTHIMHQLNEKGHL